jgi:hypothetical protein
MSDDWTREEVEAAVADYIEMLSKELRGERYNKADHNRRLGQLLRNRSRGSIEFKHQNISAILIDLGYPYIEGYKPRSNYQDLLLDVVSERLAAARALQQMAEVAVDSPVVAQPRVVDLLAMRVNPPVRQELPRRIMEKNGAAQAKVSRITNYLERESRNRELGRAGEEIVVRFEHERLWRAGKKALAERIEHVSVSQGDGLGYDVLSFDETGQERLIEVKTTRFGSMTPFFVSANEVTVSDQRADVYYLYRLYDFRDDPRLFVLDGALATNCDLKATQFRASIG